MFRCCCLAVFILMLGTALVAGAEEADWRSIPLVENGKLAEGWKFTGYGEFEVVDGALKAQPDPQGLGLLYYAKEKFGNCRIKVVFRQEHPRANSGVYVRIDDGILDVKNAPPVERNADGKLSKEASAILVQASKEELGPWYAVHHGFEVQIANSADPLHGTGSIYSLAGAREVPQAAAGTWRTMIITLDGERISVSIDGRKVSSFDGDLSATPDRKIWYEPKREAPRPEEGYIGLQTHDPGDFVSFKEIGVRPLR